MNDAANVSEARRELRRMIDRAAAARAAVRAIPLDDRRTRIEQMARALAPQRERVVRQIVEQAAIVRKVAEAEFDLGIAILADAARLVAPVRPRVVELDGVTRSIGREPYGVVGVVTPINAPFQIGLNAIACALAGGNTIVLRPAAAGLDIARATIAAVAPLWPEGAVQATDCLGAEAALELVEHPDVAVLLWYAGTAVGKRLFSAMGRNFERTERVVGGTTQVTGRLKKIIPELPGNDPFIVLPGADLDAAVAAATMAGYFNGGQLCYSAKRFLVHESLADRFIAGVVARVRELKMGDPADPTTDIGPVLKQASVTLAVHQLEDALKKGGRVWCGGEHDGRFFAPTLVELPMHALAHGDDAPTLWTEECFAPVRSLVRFSSEADAVRLANDSPYALSLYLYGDDGACDRVAAQLDGGRVIFNESPVSRAAKALPLGGVRDSGFYGATEMVEQLTYPRSTLRGPASR